MPTRLAWVVETALCAIAVGSNLGDREHTIRAGIDALRAHPQVELVRLSTLIETEPVGPGAQGRYLNGAATLRTGLPAHDLLGEMLRIERTLGRDRAKEERWGARTLDLDLLVYGRLVIEEDGLSVPHPRLPERMFVLEPLNEIAPDLLVPGRGGAVDRTVAELRRALASEKRSAGA